MVGSAVNTQMTTMRSSAAAVAALANNKGQQQAAVVMEKEKQKEKQQVLLQPQQQVTLSLTEIMAKLQLDYGNYKYTVYRCASKFVALQKIFHSK